MKKLQTWDEVFENSEFGDIRRNTRVVKIAKTIENGFGSSASSLLPDRASEKAVSRFFNTYSVTPENLTSEFIKANFENLGCNHVLIAQDTTEINFSWRKTRIDGANG